MELFCLVFSNYYFLFFLFFYIKKSGDSIPLTKKRGALKGTRISFLRDAFRRGLSQVKTSVCWVIARSVNGTHILKMEFIISYYRDTKDPLEISLIGTVYSTSATLVKSY